MLVMVRVLVNCRTSHCNMSESSSFERLSVGVQRWVYRQGWQSLRAVQEQSVPVILKAREDILITAPTAGGKTEAAFLPIVSWLEDQGPEQGYGVLCLSPLKALINDQYHRLELLCESAGTAITPWHGDISSSLKKRSWKSPTGILMITPESLEALFVNRAHELKARVASLQYVVIDEFHAFIDRERGQQLLSLLARLEQLIERPLCRVALSATIGDPNMALQYLRPDGARPGVHLDVTHESMSLQLALKTYLPQNGGEQPVYIEMAQDLYDGLRGSSHLVFANSRRAVEEITDQLAKITEAHGVPLEFYAHHGSLSRDTRHFVEQRLKDGEKPTTAVATSTLELGIDIGEVTSVAQVGAPANVSSVRQRLGRSGRRKGAPSILRLLVSGHSDRKNPSPLDLIEAELFQTVAVIELMLERWIEPPDRHALHLSTLVQQILSMIAFRGGITAAGAYEILCQHGPWSHISADFFARVLRGLGANRVIAQLPNGELIVGEVGEQLVSSYTFYTAFEVPEEYRLEAEGKTLGTLPITSPYIEGQLLLFGGRRWSVESIDVQGKIMHLVKAKRGQAPTFGGEAAPVHRAIRQRMRELYLRDDIPRFCDAMSSSLMKNARSYFREKNIDTVQFVDDSGYLFWFIWEDDRILDTFKVAATLKGLAADRMGPCVIVQGADEPEHLIGSLQDYLSSRTVEEIAAEVEPQPLGKFDKYLSDDTLREAFVSEKLDIKAASVYLGTFTANTVGSGHSS